MQEKLVSRAKELLSDGTVVRVLGWRKGDTDFSAEPAFFETAESLSEFTYDGFCGANLSKYMIKASKEEGKTLVFLKPCDTYSFNQLIKEHRVDREKTYIVGIGCDGKLDIEKIREAGCKGITAVTEDGDTIKVATVYGDKELAREDVILERCKACKGGKHVAYDELAENCDEEKPAKEGRFELVEKLEAMAPEERFAFWQNELSRCIRCNAYRNTSAHRLRHSTQNSTGSGTFPFPARGKHGKSFLQNAVYSPIFLCWTAGISAKAHPHRRLSRIFSGSAASPDNPRGTRPFPSGIPAERFFWPVPTSSRSRCRAAAFCR